MIALLGGGCGGAGDEPGGPRREGDVLPELQATTIAGEPVSLASYGGRPMVLNLWATWCPPCRAEMPYLQALHEEFSPRGLAMVGLSMDTPSATGAVEAFLEESGITYDILLDPNMAAMDVVAAMGLPVTLVVGADGRIELFRMGPVEEGDQAFEGSIEAVVAAAEAAS
jgi:peroxiredoxin